jgi:hydrogenase-4 component J
MDCLSELMVVPADDYKKCINRLPEGDGRRKLEGVLTWNEIEINRGHVDELLPAFQSLLDGMGQSEAQWIHAMIRCLHDMVVEPAVYLMVKLRA